MITLERFSGCLLGLAVGDAVGTALEFSPPGSFQPISDMVGGGPFHLRPGEWTDDTSMALCLAESLVECAGFDPVDQLERYLRWYRQGYLSHNGRCFDIGNTIRTALVSFERNRRPYPGPTDPYSAGNGSLMRLAPAAMAYARQPEQAIERCAESSRTTHGARQAVDACRYFGGLLVGALNGADKAQLLAARYSPLTIVDPHAAGAYWQAHPLDSEVDEVARGSFKVRQPPQIKGSGYSVRALEAALWAFYHTQDYRSGCLLAANLGDDADTTAAIYGQVAGAFYGEAGVPAEWLEKLAMRETIEGLAGRLFELAKADPKGF